MNFSKSAQLKTQLRKIIPGGAHTYAKGEDQFPEHLYPVLVKGKGCRVWDADDNEFTEYGMGLRSVSLGHAYEPVIEAAFRQMQAGSNFGTANRIELDCAETLLSFFPAMEMVRFSKNGSDVTTAAVKLARAATGRDHVAVCINHPFFSSDDWFIGTTVMDAGIPKAVGQI